MTRITLTIICLLCLTAPFWELLGKDATANPLQGQASPSSEVHDARPPALTPTPTEPTAIAAAEASAPLSKLARRMTAALRGEDRDDPRSHSTSAPKDLRPTHLEWTCGRWQELWQGRGSARTCEWR